LPLMPLYFVPVLIATVAMRVPFQGALTLEPPPPAGFAWAGTGKVVPVASPKPAVAAAMPAIPAAATEADKPKSSSTTTALTATTPTPTTTPTTTATTKRSSPLVQITALANALLMATTSQPPPPAGFEWGYADVNALAVVASSLVRLLMLPVTFTMALLYRVVRSSKLLLSPVAKHGPAAVGVFADIAAGLAYAMRVYVTAAMALGSGASKSFALRLTTYAPAAAGTFIDLANDLAFAMSVYATTALAASKVFADQLQLFCASMAALAEQAAAKCGSGAAGIVESTVAAKGAAVSAAMSAYERVEAGLKGLLPTKSTWGVVPRAKYVTTVPHRMQGTLPPPPPRELWKPPEGWVKPRKPVRSWYDKGVRLSTTDDTPAAAAEATVADEADEALDGSAALGGSVLFALATIAAEFETLGLAEPLDAVRAGIGL